MIVTHDLIIEEDQDVTSQGVDLRMGYPIQLGQLALQFASHRGGAFDFRDLDSDPSCKLVIVPISMHRLRDSFLKDSSTLLTFPPRMVNSSSAINNVQTHCFVNRERRSRTRKLSLSSSHQNNPHAPVRAASDLALINRSSSWNPRNRLNL